MDAVLPNLPSSQLLIRQINVIISPDGSGILLRRGAAQKIQRTAGQNVIEYNSFVLQISNIVTSKTFHNLDR